MSRILDLWRKWAPLCAVTAQQRDLWQATSDEVDDLRTRIKRLEDGATDDGK